MLLKLEAAKRALEGGVDDVRIVGGAAPGALLSALVRPGTGKRRNGSRFNGTQVWLQPLVAKGREAAVTA
jgi:hypothetical protein